MGYVYYGIYATYLEVARVEALRNLGVSYKSMEDNGVMMPVLDYQIKYNRPLHYDDELLIKTNITSLPSSRIHFEYEIFANDELKTKASTTLVFVDIEKSRPCRAPESLLKKLSEFF